MVKMKPKGFMPKNAELDLRIVFSMIKLARPVTLSEIANELNEPRQKVSYHLKYLIGNGLILPIEDNNYIVQAPFYYQKELMKFLKPLIVQLSKELDFSHAPDYEETVANFLRFLMAYWSLEL